MGQKVHPVRIPARFQPDLALALVRDEGATQTLLHEDLKLRKELKGRLSHAGVSEIDIERAANKLKVNIQTSRPGHHHRQARRRGRQAARRAAEADEAARSTSTSIEIQRPETRRPARGRDRSPCSSSAAWPFRRAMKKAIESAFRFGAKGIKIRVRRPPERRRDRARRVVPGGAPAAPHAARPTSTTASPRRNTTYGKIGVKVWIYQRRAAQGRRTAARRRLRLRRDGRARPC